MAKKQPKEMLEKMSDEQKDEVLKKTPRRDWKKSIISYEKETWKQTV